MEEPVASTAGDARYATAERHSLLILAHESQLALCQELRDALADRGFEVVVRPGASGIFTTGYLSVDLSTIDYAGHTS